MTLPAAEAYEFLKRQNIGVISTVSEQGVPEAALVNYGVTESLELILETLQTSRKFRNLHHNPQMAMVMGVGKDCLTCQYEGIAGWPAQAALPGLLDIYFAARPEALQHRGWPDLVYLHVRPVWIRISNYDLMHWNVKELRLNGPAARAASIPLPPPSHE